MSENSRFYDENLNDFVEKSINTLIDSASIEEKVNNIIANRHNRLPELNNTLDKINKMLSDLETFKNKKNDFKRNILVSNIIENLNESERKEVLENLNNNITDERINSIIEKLEKTKISCDEVIEKFEKDNICIAIVGGARNGKSKLIQTVTGLDDRLVPTSAENFCTGARSTIENDDNFKVKIEFYTEEELLKKVISKYKNYKEFIKYGSKNCNLNNLSDIKELYNCLRKEDIKNGRQYLKRLKDYAEQQEAYKSYLGCDTKVLGENQIDEIRKFVSQIEEKLLENGNKLIIKHFEFLAVKRVCIYCPFKVTTVRKIVLVDTVGLGETSLGIEDDMLDTIKKEADFVLMLRAMSKDPTAILEDDDFDISNKIINAISDIEPNKWCYWVFNRNTSNYVEGLFENRYFNNLIENLKSSDNPHFPAAILNIDCSNRDEVMNGLINPMLQHISDNLGILDKNFIYKLNCDIISVKFAYQELMSFINTVTTSNAEIDLLKNREFTSFYKYFVEAIHEFKKNYKEKCMSTIPQVKLDIIISSLIKSVPSQEEIQRKWDTVSKQSYFLTINWAFETTEERLRNRLIKASCKYDEIMDNFKKEIIDKVISITSLNKCYKFDLERKDYINDFIEKVFKNINNDNLQNLFVRFRDFDIKDTLDLTKFFVQAQNKYFNVNHNPNSQKPLFPTSWTKEDGVEKLRDCLLIHIEGIQNALEEQKDYLKNLPYNCLTGELEAFINNITNQNNEDAWRDIFTVNSSILIGDKILELKKHAKQLTEWNQIIEDLKNNSINEIK